MNKETNWSNWYYVPIISLFSYLIYRIVNQSKILFIFPLDNPNDVCAYMAHLFFLKTCGLLQQCPYWYGGFKTFTTIPPGWFVIALPIYNATKDILFTTWIMWILTFVLAFIVVMFFGGVFKWSHGQRLLFFALFYGNAIIIGNFVKLMRVHEFLALVVMTIIGFMVLYYLYNDFNIWSIFFVPLFALVIYLHPAEAVLSGVILGSLFLCTKYWKFLFHFVFMSIVLTLPWLVPYILNFKETIGINLAITKSLWSFSWTYLPQHILVIFIPLCFFFVLYKYRNNEKNHLYIRFCFLFIVIAGLLLFHLTPLIPIFNSVNVDAQLYLLIFFTLFYFMRIRFKWNKLIVVGVILISILSIGVSELYTPKFREYTQLEYDMLDMFNYIDDKYTFAGTTRMPDTSYVRAYFCYGAIYHNLTTAHGWGLPNEEYHKLLLDSYYSFKSRDCEGFRKSLLITNVTYIISYSEVDCGFISGCPQFENVNTQGDVCLYKINGG